jgi:hypothetical protein
MSKFLRHEQCPKCAERGADRTGNNLGVYADGSLHCCGYHRGPDFKIGLNNLIEESDDTKKALLPSDYTKEIPTEYWKWLLQYGLPYSYWQARCGYSEKEGRLIFLIGSPPAFALGRCNDVGASKWKVYGDKSSYVEVVSEQLSGKVVLVEDVVSAHKVGQVATCIPLFGTSIGDRVIAKLQDLNRPVVLWLDRDQYVNLSKKMGRLQALLSPEVDYISTRKDPKEYTAEEIKGFLQ